MAAFIISQDTSLLTCLDQANITRSLLAANPLTASLAAAYDTWVVEWKAVFLQEIDHRIAQTGAAALEVSIDADLNDLSDETSRTVLIFTKDDRTDSEFLFYFKGERPSDFKKPHLGPQLASMRGWVKHMSESPYPPIVDLGTRIAAKVAEADAAIEKTSVVEQEARAFELTGARRQLIDSLNALRKATHGTLSEMPHKQPGLKLPATFADRFFRAERPTAPSRPPSAAALKVQMEALQTELDKLTLDYTKAAKAEADLITQKAADAATALELAEAETALEKQKLAVAALKAKLEK